MKKELARFFGDRRMVLTTLLLPGLLIYVMYNFMGDAIANMATGGDDYTASVEAVNPPASLKTVLESGGVTVTVQEDAQAAKERVQKQELDALLGSVGGLGSFGFGVTSKEHEEASNKLDDED